MADACLLAVLAPRGPQPKEAAVSKPILSLLMVMLIGASAASRAFCADIGGTILDGAGNRVPGIKVVAMRDRTGEVAGQAISGAKGEYYIPHIAPETYDIALDPLGKPFEPATAVASVPKQGLLVNWRVSESAPASALAAPRPVAPFLLGGVLGGVAPDLAGLLISGTTGIGAGAIAGSVTGGGASGSSGTTVVLPAQTSSQ